MTPRGFLRLLYALVACRHEHMRRVRIKGVLYLECECGHVVEAIQRTNAERRQMAKRWPSVSQPRSHRVGPAKVEPLRRTK